MLRRVHPEARPGAVPSHTTLPAVFPAIRSTVHLSPLPIPFSVRPARPDDVPVLPRIDRSAAQLFRRVPALAWIAESDTLPMEVHNAAVAASTCWVAVDEQDRPVGFLTARIFDGDLHLHEMSVERRAQGQGAGRALLKAAHAMAMHRQLDALTLTTFRDTPWNGPFYSRAGFVEIPAAVLTPRLRALLLTEIASGFAEGSRCAMRRTVVPAPVS